MAGQVPKAVKIIIAAALVAGGLYYYFAVDKAKEGVKSQAITVRTAVSVVQDVPVTVRQVGTVVANQTVAVRSRIDSQIIDIKFHDGDTVKEGDVLFVLDDRTLSAQHRQEKANLVNLQSQYERTKALISKQYVSQADLDQALAAYEAQKALADSIATQLDYTRIRAPISGRTGTINVTVGNTVKANDTQPLVVINQMQPIRVQLSLPQQYLEKVRESMAAGDIPVSATREGGSTPSVGKMEYIDNAVDQSSGTFAARALFANENDALWPGMFVTLEATLGTQRDAVTVPEVAVQHGQTGDYVFIINGNKAIKQDVTLLRVQEGAAVITQGLKGNETVAVDGLLSLKDGSEVVVTSAPEKPADPDAP